MKGGDLTRTVFSGGRQINLDLNQNSCQGWLGRGQLNKHDIRTSLGHINNQYLLNWSIIIIIGWCPRNIYLGMEGVANSGDTTLTNPFSDNQFTWLRIPKMVFISLKCWKHINCLLSHCVDESQRVKYFRGLRQNIFVARKLSSFISWRNSNMATDCISLFV